MEHESIYHLVSEARGTGAGPATRVHDTQFTKTEPTAQILKPRRMHEDSRQVENLFNPVRGFRDAQKRKGIMPTDHAKNNMRAIKQQSEINAQKKMEEEYGPGCPGVRTTGRRPTSSVLRPSRSSDSSRDFVHENIVDAGTFRKSSDLPKKDGSEFLSKVNYGRVPTYLHERKMELAANYARQQAQKEAALIPEGMRMMSEEERLETLQILDQNHREVQDAVQRLPFVIETPSQIRHKNQLETRLKEIEEARKIFSRPKVLVKSS